MSSDVVESLWSPAQCQTTLLALNHVLYDVIQLRGNDDDYYNINNSFIDKVPEFFNIWIDVKITKTFTSFYKGPSCVLNVCCFSLSWRAWTFPPHHCCQHPSPPPNTYQKQRPPPNTHVPNLTSWRGGGCFSLLFFRIHSGLVCVR